MRISKQEFEKIKSDNKLCFDDNRKLVDRIKTLESVLGIEGNDTKDTDNTITCVLAPPGLASYVYNMLDGKWKSKTISTMESKIHAILNHLGVEYVDKECKENFLRKKGKKR